MLTNLTGEALPWLATEHPELLDKARRHALLQRVIDEPAANTRDVLLGAARELAVGTPTSAQ